MELGPGSRWDRAAPPARASWKKVEPLSEVEAGAAPPARAPQNLEQNRQAQKVVPLFSGNAGRRSRAVPWPDFQESPTPTNGPPRVRKNVLIRHRPPGGSFCFGKYVRPAAARRPPSVGILKCFDGRLRIAILVPSVKESTAGSQLAGSFEFPLAR